MTIYELIDQIERTLKQAPCLQTSALLLQALATAHVAKETEYLAEVTNIVNGNREQYKNGQTAVFNDGYWVPVSSAPIKPIECRHDTQTVNSKGVASCNDCGMVGDRSGPIRYQGEQQVPKPAIPVSLHQPIRQPNYPCADSCCTCRVQYPEHYCTCLHPEQTNVLNTTVCTKYLCPGGMNHTGEC